MQNHSTKTGLPSAAPAAAAISIPTLLFRVAWMSICLGLVMQLLTMTVGGLFGGKLAAISQFLAELSGKVTWSSIVCSGVALGAAAAKANRAWAGIAGVFAAPAAFVAAKAVQKGIGAAGGVPPQPDPSVLLQATVIVLKAAQYGALGLAVVWIARQRWGGLGAHIGVGLATGVLFGSAIIGVTYANTTPAMALPRIAAQTVNELVFPIGCALVLYAAGRMGERIRA
ncbi:MAG: hypothetical protein JNG88_18275 [Phycisphaerales bacterium]|nr:hypothetical protein [Phycisphaerales bacterium]